MILILTVFSLPHELQRRPFWFPGFFSSESTWVPKVHLLCPAHGKPERVHRSLSETSNEAKGNMFTMIRKIKMTKNISVEAILMFIVNIVDYI